MGRKKSSYYLALDLFFLFLSRHREQLADKFWMILPSEEVAESVVNKRRLYELAAAHGTPFPRSYFPCTYVEALAVKDALRYPAFIKPYWGHQWRRGCARRLNDSGCRKALLA